MRASYESNGHAQNQIPIKNFVVGRIIVVMIALMALRRFEKKRVR